MKRLNKPITAQLLITLDQLQVHVRALRLHGHQEAAPQEAHRRQAPRGQAPVQVLRLQGHPQAQPEEAREDQAQRGVQKGHAGAVSSSWARRAPPPKKKIWFFFFQTALPLLL